MKPWTGSFVHKRRRGQKLLLGISFFVFLSLLCVHAGLQKIGTEFLNRPLNILVLGVDALAEDDGFDWPRSDTILFVALRPETGRIGVFSIPRDSLVEIPGLGRERINKAYAYGGYDLTRRVVEEVMGRPVHRYVVVNFEGFKELVDLVGGVEITVDKRMLYTDHSAGFRIDLQPGPQTLLGEDALGYVRYRQDRLGDITRVQRQQKFLSALARKLAQKEMVFKAFSLLRIARKYLQTDLTLPELAALYCCAGRFNLEEDLITATLPGEFYQVYWRLHEKEISRLLEREGF